MSTFRLFPLPWLLSSAAGVMGVSCSLMLGYSDQQVTSLSPPDSGVESDTALADAGDPSDGGSNSDPVPEAGADAEPDATDDRLKDVVPPVEPIPVLQLAFIEDPAEDTARLRLVDVRESLLPNQVPVEAPSWRRTLNAGEQAGDALDFAWSPDGRHIALRYMSLDGPRMAFFAMPGGVELPVDDLAEPATPPEFEPTANYAWSPDSAALAVEVTGGAGPSVGAFLVGAERAVPVPPVALAAPPESMAWASSTRLFVAQENLGGREIVILDRSRGALAQQRLDTAPFVAPLKLRSVAGGILGAGDALSSLYFWTPAGAETEHKALSYISSQQWFVADAEAQSPVIYAVGNIAEPVANLPDCPVVLTWVDGPNTRSLTQSKVACVSVANAAANIAVHAFDENAVAGVTALTNESLRAAFNAESDWLPHARTFSPDGGWLVIATATSDCFIDLRDAAPAPFVTDARSTGTTATTFAPSGKHVLFQRGQQVTWWQFEVSKNGSPTYRTELDALVQPTPCETAPNNESWCGAPNAGAITGARWAPKDDVAVLLTADQGLVEIAPSDDGFGSGVTSVSTCGAGCVTAYAFSP